MSILKTTFMSFIDLIKTRINAILVATLLLWGFDFIFYSMQLAQKFPRSVTQFFTCFIFSFIISMAFLKKTFWNFIIFFISLAFLQMLSVTYFGSYISPMMMFLFFKETGEVLETFQGVWKTLLLPTLFFVISISVIIFSQKLDKANWQEWNFRKYLKYIFSFMLIYPGIRTFYTGHTFGKQAVDSQLGFINFYGSFSYFLSRVLPAKLKKSDLQQIIIPKPQKTEDHPKRHVIFILGESMALNHLSLFGYEKPTTPQLDVWESNQKLVKRKAISGGVSTDVSIPMLMHATQGMKASTYIASQDRCLFKLAQQNGFETSFLSAQPQEDLKHITNFLCSKYLNHFHIEPNPESGAEVDSSIQDSKLIDFVSQLNWEMPQFAVFHQRGSHSPYEKRYPLEKAFLPIKGDSSSKEVQMEYYDNSIHFSDEIIISLIEKIRNQSKLPVEVIFTSDHGEALGDNGHWGHVILEPVVAEVPFVYFPSNEQIEMFKKHNSNSLTYIYQVQHFPEWINHFQIMQFLLNLIGYAEEAKPADFFVMGADLDGLDGGMYVRPVADHLQKIEKN